MRSNQSDQIHLIGEALEILDIRFRSEHVLAFSLYLEMLKKWSRAYNLTSIKEDREIVVKHFIDSLIYLKVIPDSAVTLADIGTGAGFPGVPVKIVRPDLKVYLIEPSRKKTSFLRKLIKELSLHDIFVLRCRVEEYPCDQGDTPERFGVVTTRALYKIDEFVIKASHLCASNGIMVISKGPAFENELTGLSTSKYEIVKAGLEEFGIDRSLVLLRP